MSKYARPLKRVPDTRGATTAEVMWLYEREQNPVTKSVYRQIIANRIDRPAQVLTVR